MPSQSNNSIAKKNNPSSFQGSYGNIRPFFQNLLKKLLILNTTKSATSLSKQSTADQLHYRSILILRLGVLSTAVILIITFFVMYIANQQVTQLKLVQKNVITTQLSSLDLASAQVFLDSQQQEIALISATLPDETTLIEFIKTMELIASQSAANSIIKFSALAPATSGQYKYIPFTITMTTNKSNFEEFLSKLEKLPYLVEVTSFENSSGDLLTTAFDVTITAKVYVQDPFKPAEAKKL